MSRKHQLSAIGTLVERRARTVRLLHLPQRDGDTLDAALRAPMADVPPSLLRSITWGWGPETDSTTAPRLVLEDRSPAALLASHVRPCCDVG